MWQKNGRVAQLDRAASFQGAGQGFDSPRESFSRRNFRGGILTLEERFGLYLFLKGLSPFGLTQKIIPQFLKQYVTALLMMEVELASLLDAYQKGVSR